MIWWIALGLFYVRGVVGLGCWFLRRNEDAYRERLWDPDAKHAGFGPLPELAPMLGAPAPALTVDALYDEAIGDLKEHLHYASSDVRRLMRAVANAPNRWTRAELDQRLRDARANESRIAALLDKAVAGPPRKPDAILLGPKLPGEPARSCGGCSECKIELWAGRLVGAPILALLWPLYCAQAPLAWACRQVKSGAGLILWVLGAR